MALYLSKNEYMFRDWVMQTDAPTFNYLEKHFVTQKRVIRDKTGKVKKVIYFSNILKVLEKEYGVMCPGLTRSKYISHEVKDIINTAFDNILQDKHLEQEPPVPINFETYAHILLNDIAGSHLFKTNDHALRYKFAQQRKQLKRDEATGSLLAKPVKHIHLDDSEAMVVAQAESEVSVTMQPGLEDEIADLRKFLQTKEPWLVKVLDLLLQNHSATDIASMLNKSKSKIYLDIDKIKTFIREYHA
ncbi:hypothetical protein [Ketobacter sp.]|uniref:hypothetical protein n=1 Tax=Ketobacter sp. TaxID=2083498 RepID=UPI000F12197F|nr:hypothetical protein [Ketobacter sp.]RLU01743.1 MAG: hypothetical protein D9N14_00995 [Ketobacter sp.]